MSSSSTPDPSAYDGKVTQEQINELERLRVGYVNSKGSANEDTAREAYQDYAVALTIDLSGKLEPGPDVEPEGPYIKPGGWGASTDPNTWKVAPMKDNPSMFKVVDDKGKNVATGFKTVAGANAYIEKAKGGTIPPVPPGPGPTGDKDQFGVLKVYPDKPGSEVNTKFKLEEKQRNYASGKPSEGSVEYTATARSKEQNSDIEATIYSKINGFKTKEADSMSLKTTGPNHSDGNKSWVIPDFMTDGSGGKTLETENPHPKNKGVNPKPLTKIGGSLVGQWCGMKAITWIAKDGKRYVESWLHYPVTNIDNVGAEQDKWRQYVPRTEIEKSCTAANGLLFTARLDGTQKGSPPDFRFCSVREIEPPA